MGNEAERDVIINLRLAGDSNNDNIANQVASKVESVVTAGNAAYQKLESIAEKTHAQITEVHAASSDLQVKTEKFNTEARMRLLENLAERSIEIHERSLATELTADEKKAAAKVAADKKAVKEVKKTQKKLKAAQEATIAGRQKANESAVTIVQGLADITEGSVKLGLVSKENVEIFAEKFALVEEGIRVFKGFTDVIWKSREGLIALGVSTLAQADANLILNASNMAGGVGGKAGGKVAGTAAKTAASTAISTGTNMAAGGGATFAMMMGAKALAALALAGAELLAIALVLTEALQALSRPIEWAIGANWKWNESILVAGDGALRASEVLAKSAKKTEEAEKRRIGLEKQREEYERKNAVLSGFSSQLIEADGAVIAAESGSESNGEKITALKQLERAEIAVAEAKKYNQESEKSDTLRSTKNLIRTQRDMEEAQGRVIAAEKAKLSVIQEQKRAIDDQLKSEKEKLQTTLDAGKSAEQRFNEKYGKLDPLQKERVDDVTEKLVAGKSLTRADIDDIDNINRGSLGVAFYPTEVATVVTLRQAFFDDAGSDISVYLGDGVTIADIIKSGGDLDINSDTTTFEQTAGETTIHKGAHALLNVLEGTLNYNSIGTATAINLAGGSLLNFNQDRRPKTITLINKLSDDSRIVDSSKCIVATVIDMESKSVGSRYKLQDHDRSDDLMATVISSESVGTVSYPGIKQIVSASYTRSHGIAPGVCLIEMAPQTLPDTRS